MSLPNGTTFAFYTLLPRPNQDAAAINNRLLPTSDAVQASRRWGASKTKCHEEYLEPLGEDKALTPLHHQSTPTPSSSFSGCIPGPWIHLEPRAAGEQWQRTANRSLWLSVGCSEKSPWLLLQRIIFLLQWILSIYSNAYSSIFQKGTGIILFICSYQSGRQWMDMVQCWNWEELSTGHQELRQNLLEARSWGRKTGRDLVICSNGQNQVCFIENHHKILYWWGVFLCLQSWWQRSFFFFFFTIVLVASHLNGMIHYFTIALPIQTGSTTAWWSTWVYIQNTAPWTLCALNMLRKLLLCLSTLGEAPRAPFQTMFSSSWDRLEINWSIRHTAWMYVQWTMNTFWYYICLADYLQIALCIGWLQIVIQTSVFLGHKHAIYNDNFIINWNHGFTYLIIL